MIEFSEFRSASARRLATFASAGQQCAGLAGLSWGLGAARADVDLFFQDSKVFSGQGFAGDLGFREGCAQRPAVLAGGEQPCAGLAGSSCGLFAARADVDLFFQDSKVFSGQGFALTGSFASASEMRASALV